MYLQHGTDKPEAVEMWKSHNLNPSAFDIDAYEDYDENGDIIESEIKAEFKSKNLNKNRVVYLSRSDRFYAQHAKIEIEVDEGYVVQISDDEYVMSIDAPYTVLNVLYNNKDYSQKLDSRIGDTW